MTSWIIFAFGWGIISGFSCAYLMLWLIKVKCPKCQKFRPLSQVIIFHRKTFTITGQPCRQCRSTPNQLDIF